MASTRAPIADLSTCMAGSTVVLVRLAWAPKIIAESSMDYVFANIALQTGKLRTR